MAMKKGLKIVLFVLIGVVVLLVLVVGIIAANLNSIVKVGVEKGGTMVLKVDTTLDKASISLLAGSLGLDGLRLGSPQGFSAEHMFSLGHASTDVDIASLKTDNIRIEEVVVDGAEITLEFSKFKSNYGTLLEQLESDTKEEEKAEEPKDAASEKTFQVDRIVFKNSKIHIAGIPAVKKATVPLLSVEIKGLGAEGKGITARQMVYKIMSALLKSTVVAVKDVLPTEYITDFANQIGSLVEGGVEEFAAVGIKVTETVRAGAEELGEAGKEALEATAGGALKGAGTVTKTAEEGAEGAVEGIKKGGEAVTGGVKKTGERIKGLFGGSDKKEEK